jgi:hypothetical protein
VNRLLILFILSFALSATAAAEEKAPAPKVVHVVIQFTVDSDGVPKKIKFVKPVGKGYEKSVLDAVSKWRLPKAYAGKSVEQAFDFVDEPKKEAPNQAAQTTPGS